MGITVSEDDYVEKVIKQGDRGSDHLSVLVAKTFGNSPLACIEGSPYQLPGLRLPEGSVGVVHSDIGEGKTLEKRAESLLERLIEGAMRIGATPVGFTNIIDSVTGDDSIILPIRDTFLRVANERKLVCFNGENAILGSRVAGDANISGTMISYADPEELMSLGFKGNGIFGTRFGNIYIAFNHNGEFLFMNSDGVGTWHEFTERLGPEHWPKANRNALAMVADDAAKNSGEILAYSGVYERNKLGEKVADNVPDEMTRLCRQFGFPGTLQTRTGNVQSYRSDIPAYNIGGSAVSAISQARLNNLPVPQEDDYLVVLRGRKPNPRSNGISAKREGEVKMRGQEWHETDWGRYDMEFLSGPCSIFYGLFKDCFDKEIAHSVYHMSGGAFNGKLAKPLAKLGLYAELDYLYEPDEREMMLASVTSPTIDAAYAKCPMGNEAFTATKQPKSVMSRAENHGFDAMIAGRIQRLADGTTGVRFYAKGKEVYFSGK